MKTYDQRLNQQVKKNQARSNEEKTISELETQPSRKTSSKEIVQQADKGNEDSVLQNFIGSVEKVNPQQKEILDEMDHPMNQNVNDLED